MPIKIIKCFHVLIRRNFVYICVLYSLVLLFFMLIFCLLHFLFLWFFLTNFFYFFVIQLFFVDEKNPKNRWLLVLIRHIWEYMRLQWQLVQMFHFPQLLIRDHFRCKHYFRCFFLYFVQNHYHTEFPENDWNKYYKLMSLFLFSTTQW